MIMGAVIVVLASLFELIGISGFLFGYFAGIKLVMLVGGCMLVFDHIYEMGVGILKPLFPILLAIPFVILMTPWYVGVFWSIAVLKVFNIPGSIMKIFMAKRIASEA